MMLRRSFTCFSPSIFHGYAHRHTLPSPQYRHLRGASVRGRSPRAGFRSAVLLSVQLFWLSCAARCCPQESDYSTAAQRRQAGEDLLAVLSGERLSDPDREQRFLSSMIEIPSPSPPLTWTAVNAAVKESGYSGIKQQLTDQIFHVPDVENCREYHCQLTLYRGAARFKSDANNLFVANLFMAIATASNVPFPKVDLSRFDLFHTHLVRDYRNGEVALVFHSREYPKTDKENFPYILGFCQRNSSLTYSELKMDYRNFLWYEGKLVALDTSEGSIVMEELLFPGTEIFRTILEDELGTPVLDLYYFNSLTNYAQQDRVFACMRTYLQAPLPQQDPLTIQ